LGQQVSEIAETLRGLEGTAGRIYFETLSRLLAKEYQFSGRSSRPAQDAFNAFLNYAYGMLYSKVERALIIAGLDPYLGFLHRDDYNQLSFVFDFIEPYRIYADTVVFRLFSAKKVNQSHTDQITNGFSLNQAGKELLVVAFNKYLEEDTIRYRGRNQTRSNGLQMDAHTFANSLIAPKEETV
jgi:CRISPR-associated protein Cas1